MIFLAQTGIETIPPGILKWMIVFMVGLIIVAGILVGMYANLKKKSVHISPQPLSVTKTPKRFNHDLAEGRHNEVVRRLDSHDAEIEQIWTTFRAEDAAIRKENTETMKTIMLALGRIQGRLGIEPKDQV